jgi:hypothetical protein
LRAFAAVPVFNSGGAEWRAGRGAKALRRLKIGDRAHAAPCRKAKRLIEKLEHILIAQIDSI